MKMRIPVVLVLLSVTLPAIVGCGNGNTTVTPVKDTTPQPAAAPAAGADST